MSLPAWHEEPISKAQDRSDFDCGDADTNVFLARYARQSHEQNATKTYCAIETARPGRILGFYSIAPSALGHAAVPARMTKGLARHDVPGFLLARIATDRSIAGQGLGGQLLAAAARRCLRLVTEGGGIVLIIDAKNERAADWYASFGAEPLQSHRQGQPLRLVIHLATFAADLRVAGHL
ncbi:GNAT family N-acetyltransferase [Mesorhizobium tamadayense]|uniref:GNAT family N-acetyltransferase n=1 Tax=Mesorhizobium tamadayense TaxID=425306 RepID=A0A3P3F3J4_9HYPH|nr:GNAT family N-acetyltransferase [Mesorhizobium tamadayense]RRH93209.1 GNAT family N-acetyltransferase [Mesorhizobium tamadayense]